MCYLVEGEYVEPGALVAGGVQVHPHGVLLQQRRQPLVDRQVLVGLDVQQLNNIAMHLSIKIRRPPKC